ncbi:MAG: DNA replication and repair protein RecF [Leptospiraceae bacterium]|nr:DNA replication and repair protein RecF [Leptospiraceae bacterium]
MPAPQSSGSLGAAIAQELSLTNFRNQKSLRLKFSHGLIFLTGKNGSGKTSVLEAIGLISFLRSFRKATDRDMLCFGTPYYRIECSFSVHGTAQQAAIAFGRNSEDPRAATVKKYWLNGQEVKAAGLIGRLACVVLTPDDIGILDGEHSERRRFLDLLLSTLSPGYFSALQQYHRALKLRSQALQSRADEGVLGAIDRELASHGMEILNRRREFLPEFAEYFNHNVHKISSAKDNWQMCYRGTTDQLASIDDYLAMLRAQRAHDLRLRQTTCGVHRDRLYFFADGNAEREIRSTASQGQKRTAALALRMAQYFYLGHKLRLRPVLLIDDVLNELDLNRRAAFIEFLRDTGQVFFTTTDLTGMQDFLAALGQDVAVQTISLSPD